MPLTRRALLAVAGIGAVAGCTGTPGRAATRPRGPSAADAGALVVARRHEARILAAYDAKIQRLPLRDRASLQVERAIHATHLAALGSVTGATTAGQPAPAPVHGSLRAALQSSAAQLRRLALHASDGRDAALLASIAAAHAAGAQ